MDIPLVSLDEYLKLGRLPTPYFFYIKSGKQILYYLGVMHTYDPEDPIIPVIKYYWSDFSDFVKITQDKNAIALNEGGNRAVKETEREAMLKGGEPSLLTYLANKQKIPCESPEPPQKHEVTEILKKYSKDEILTYYFLRQAHTWNKLKQKRNFNEHMQSYLSWHEERLGWKSQYFDLDYMIKKSEELTGHKFEADNTQLLWSLTNPLVSKTVINEVSRSTGNIRDIYIVKQIHKHWAKQRSIFVLFGKGHAITQEPALRKLLL